MPRVVLFALVGSLVVPGCGGISPLPGGLPFQGAGTGIEEEGEFRLTSLTVDPVTDGDGDGVEDNHLPTALAAVDTILPDQGFGLDDFNARMDDEIENYAAVLFGAHAVAEDFSLDVWQGAVQPDQTVAVDAASVVTIDGGIAMDYSFNAGPGDIPLQFSVTDGLPPATLELYDTTVTGDWADGALGGTFEAVISVDQVVADVVEPEIPDSGWDLDGDGVNEPKDAILALVENIAPTVADTVTAAGDPAISVRLVFSAVPSEVPLPTE